MKFQCRTQHCVCRDEDGSRACDGLAGFNAARSIVCVETDLHKCTTLRVEGFNAARSIVCVETSGAISRNEAAVGFNAARSIVCVETIQWA